jgi:hypothetical protein
MSTDTVLIGSTGLLLLLCVYLGHQIAQPPFVLEGATHFNFLVYLDLYVRLFNLSVRQVFS